MTKQLKERKCVPCKGGVPPLTKEVSHAYLEQLKNWDIIEGHHLEKIIEFKNFVDALSFTNQVGKIAEEEGHHPDIYLAWGKVKLTVWTHKIDGLTESDFIFSAKVDALLQRHVPTPFPQSSGADEAAKIIAGFSKNASLLN